MLLKKHYILLLLSTLLFGNVTAKEYNKSEIESSVKSTSISNMVIISGENITLINSNIFNVLKNGNSANIKATGNVKLQAGKKIVFKPGTKLTAKKGVSFHAGIITGAQENKPDEFIAAGYKFFKQINNSNKEDSDLSKGADSGSLVPGSPNVLAIVVENQQRKVVGSTGFVYHDFQKAATAKNNNKTTKGSGFNPETIKVLRL